MSEPILKRLERFRFQMFWFVDVIKGAKIKKHLNEISFVLEHFNDEKAQKIIQQRLNDLLLHSIKTTPFYQDLKNKKTILNFPVINKNIINENKKRFISNSYKHKNNKQIATSGSTGIPFRIKQNKNKVHRHLADTLYFSECAGYQMGYKLLYLRHWSATYKNSKIKNRLQNVWPLEVLHLNEAYMSDIINTIKKDKSRKGWLGFPSAFNEICNYLDKIKSPPINANIKFIIGMAEGLHENTKQRMTYYFKAPMVSRYSNMENGIIAQQIPLKGNDFKVNWASYYIEIFDIDHDTPAAKGALGRIVVTDLFNFAMPLIRYDTGDIGMLDDTQSPPVLKKIEGRKVDLLYDTKGNVISPFVMTNLIQYDGIKQLQVIQQTKNDFELKLNTTQTFKLENKLKRELLLLLGDDAHIRICYVKEIPRLHSGKQKVTVNNYSKSK